MLTYFVTLVIRLVSNTETNKSVNTIVNNVGNDKTKHYIGNSTFGVALQLKGEHPEYLLDPTYFTVDFLKETYQQNGANLFQPQFEFIGSTFWDSSFPVQDEIFQRLELNKAICPDTQDYFIQGNSISDSWVQFAIEISKWVNSPDWKDNDEIEYIINTHDIELFTINSYFDFDDYDNPVKTYVADTDVQDLDNGFTQITDIQVNYNKAESNEAWFYSSSPKTYEFHSHKIKSSFTSSEQIEGLLMYISFHVDDEVIIYERQVFNILDMFGLLGGLYEIFEIMGGFILSSLNRKLMYNSLFKQLYYVRGNYHKSNEVETMKTMNKIAPINLNFRAQNTLIEENK